MLLAKQSLNDPIDMHELRRCGPADKTEELRLEIYERVRALNRSRAWWVTTVLDVKVDVPTHAASFLLG